MTLNLDNPVIFSDGSMIRLNEDNTVTPLEVLAKTVDYIRLITEPMDLIPSGRDANKEILHLEPGDILLTFRDWELNEKNIFYRVVIKNDELQEYLTKLIEYRKEKAKNTESSIKEACCDEPCGCF